MKRSKVANSRHVFVGSGECQTLQFQAQIAILEHVVLQVP